MKKVLIVLFFLLSIIICIASAIYIYIRVSETEDTPIEDSTTEIASVKIDIELDSEKISTHLSKANSEIENAYWSRMWLYWNEIEEEQGKYDWGYLDERVEMSTEDEIYLLITIMPFANWDQDTCHDASFETEFDPKKGGQLKVGKPCDMEAYKQFLVNLVERYDGDGTDDMLGLRYPIKYWEIMNEPTMQGGSTGGMGEDLKFFVGTPEEYVEILKASYETIKKTDPQAMVVQGGMAGMNKDFVKYWTDVFEAGGGKYFDIANNHTISTDERREDLYMLKFVDFLEQYDLQDKPIWITEVQFGELDKPPKDLEVFEKLLVKGTVFSLALGADKLFYVENWYHWDDDDSEKKIIEEEKDEPKKKKTEDFSNSSTHQVYLNLIDKLNYFDTVEIIDQEYTEYEEDWEGASCEIGQYKFSYQGNDIYVLWGNTPLPKEIQGMVVVTDIYGEEEIIEAKDIVLSDIPVFVEMEIE